MKGLLNKHIRAKKTLVCLDLPPFFLLFQLKKESVGYKIIKNMKTFFIRRICLHCEYCDPFVFKSVKESLEFVER